MLCVELTAECVVSATGGQDANWTQVKKNADFNGTTQKYNNNKIRGQTLFQSNGLTEIMVNEK